MKSDPVAEPGPLLTCRRKPAGLDLPALETFAAELLRRVAKGAEFHCLLTNDAELRRLNLQFRQKDETTDVLSFPTTSPEATSPEQSSGRLGDIAISLQRARAQARDFGHGLEDEIRILLLHGVLHLRGMDHETDSGEMRRTETRWRKKFGLPTGLIERAV